MSLSKNKRQDRIQKIDKLNAKKVKQLTNKPENSNIYPYKNMKYNTYKK